MAASVRVTDRGANDLLRRMKEAGEELTVRVGVIGDEAEAQHQADDLTVVDIATAHEFGVGVPQRSWLREWVDENEPELQRRMRAIADAVVKRGLPLKPGLDAFGEKAVGEIKQRISGSIPPPNSPVTIARKGSSTTLINTEQFRSSITSDVVKGRP